MESRNVFDFIFQVNLTLKWINFIANNNREKIKGDTLREGEI